MRDGNLPDDVAEVDDTHPEDATVKEKRGGYKVPLSLDAHKALPRCQRNKREFVIVNRLREALTKANEKIGLSMLLLVRNIAGR